MIGRFVHLEKNNGRGDSYLSALQQLDAVRRYLMMRQHMALGKATLFSIVQGQVSPTPSPGQRIRLSICIMTKMIIFDTAIIVTDRLVLDRQLQDTISGFSQVKGVVQKIDGTSKDLKKAIEDGARIIITTIQKFGTEHLAEISGQSSKNFAVIVDEAHSSQSGKAAQSMSDALTREERSSEEIEDIILAHQKARGLNRILRS